MIYSNNLPLGEELFRCATMKAQRLMTPGYSWPHPVRRVVRFSDTPERAVKDKKGNVLLIYRGTTSGIFRSLTRIKPAYTGIALRELRKSKGVGRPIASAASGG
jgi:hypothetical protein